MTTFFARKYIPHFVGILYSPAIIGTILPSYFSKMTSTIDNKYKIHDDMAYRGLIGSILGIIFYYPFGSFYHDMHNTYYDDKENYVLLTLQRFGVWGHGYMGSVKYKIYDNTHYIFKKCKEEHDIKKQNEIILREKYKHGGYWYHLPGLGFSN